MTVSNESYLVTFDAKNAEIKLLRELVVHCWVHSGYRDCGFEQMTAEQKRLYRTVTKGDGS